MEYSYQKEIEEAIKNFCLMDDEYMTAFFEDNIECTELVLKIILNIDLKVKSVKTQYGIKNLQGRSIRLDIYAESADGKKFNIEIQRQDKGAGVKRARYNSSILDANLILPGENFDDLPETYIIFITENDVLKLNEPIYFIERSIIGKNKLFNDGTHIVYVNNSIRDDTPLGKLMHDFICKEPDEMNYEILAERSKGFKYMEEGEPKMSKVMDDFRKKVTERVTKEVIKKEHQKMAIKLVKKKFSLEDIVEITDLPLEEVKMIATENLA